MKDQIQSSLLYKHGQMTEGSVFFLSKLSCFIANEILETKRLSPIPIKFL